MAATLIVIAGAAEDQMAMDGPKNGAFTTALLSVWNHGKFDGSYTAFIAAVKRQMQKSQQSGSPQQPQLWVGGPDPAAAARKPFRFSGPNSDAAPSAKPAAGSR
jgi:hypothetical protein